MAARVISDSRDLTSVFVKLQLVFHHQEQKKKCLLLFPLVVGVSGCNDWVDVFMDFICMVAVDS